MKRNIFNYLSVLQQAGITPDIGEQICNILSDETLKKLTRIGVDRRIINPLLCDAAKRGLSDESVNALLDDTNYICSLISTYAKQ